MTLSHRLERRFWRAMLAIALVYGLCGCGAAPQASLVDGEWTFALEGATCANGAAPTGALVLYEGTDGSLSGQYGVCAAASAGSDLTGRIRGQRFELALFAGHVGVVNGWALPDALSGEVIGLGAGVQFHAVRRGARSGKPLGPPP